MRFHVFGADSNPLMILIHGVLTPWQIWQEQIDYFQKDFCVIVPALDGHVEEEASEFVSVEDEANKISEYVTEHYGRDIDALCGLSMGGAIAYIIFERGKFNIKNLVIDGGPLAPIGKLPTWVMIKSYQSIIHKSKNRDSKTLESFKKNFLPESYLPMFLKFADTMTDSTIENMIQTVTNTNISKTPVTNNTKILYLHGTKGNEVISKKAAYRMKGVYSQTEIKCFEGYAHAELAICHKDEWIRVVCEFMNAE